MPDYRAYIIGPDGHFYETAALDALDGAAEKATATGAATTANANAPQSITRLGPERVDIGALSLVLLNGTLVPFNSTRCPTLPRDGRKLRAGFYGLEERVECGVTSGMLALFSSRPRIEPELPPVTGTPETSERPPEVVVG